MNLERCMFCNSASHSYLRCNSNMNGKHDYLQYTAVSMMLNVLMPKFNSFTYNELKYIAHKYNEDLATDARILKYKHRRLHLHWDPCVSTYLCTPIKLTLTKTRMVNDLTFRWTHHDHIRDNRIRR